MKTRSNPRRSGLVLLIVLGMLALLSLLAVTFVVYSGQARTASIALIKRDFRETPADKLLDDAFKQILRGTTDTHSIAFKNDILGDLYGSDRVPASGPIATNIDVPLFLTARLSASPVARDNPMRVASLGYVVPSAMSSFTPTSPEAPKTYPVSATPGQFLKIPVEWTTGSFTVGQFPLPEQWDGLTGRVLTFLQGPLSGRSFRIVRYIGEVDVVDISGTLTLDPLRADLQYTVTIDMSEAMDDIVSVRNPDNGQVESRSVSSWLAVSPAALLYNKPATLEDSYIFLVNAGTTNASGMGMDVAGNVTNTTTTYGSFSIPDSFLANRGKSSQLNGAYVPTGDTDEPWDAPDAENFYLAHKREPLPSSSGGDDIIPSFHRPAIINYLVSISPDLSTINKNNAAEVAAFIDYLELIERATGRPVSYNIRGLTTPGGTPVRKNTEFSGSNGLSSDFATGLRAPQLEITWANVPSSAENDKFEAWLRWLTRGPWDIDNDGDGIADSLWVDLNFPLITSPEGKLLKTLVAFYIEDMDGKIDINAAGDRSQSADSTGALVMASNKYGHLHADPVAANAGHWPQGMGFGTAEISARPVLAAGEYAGLFNARYASASTSDTGPGQVGNDVASMLLERNRADSPSMVSSGATAGFPAAAFPMAVQGKSGLGLDLLGNPILVETSAINETLDDAYEARLLFHGRGDSPFTPAEYQRLLRLNDLDRAALPRRLQTVLSSTFSHTNAISAYLNSLRSISPRNASLSLPAFPLEYTYPRYTNGSGTQANATRRVSSFIEFVEAFAQGKPLSTPAPPLYFPRVALQRLFPLEFMQNRPLDLNRAFGNGLDDNLNAIIDDADETVPVASYAATIPPPSSMPFEEYERDATGQPFNFDPTLESQPAAIQSRYSGNRAKQLFARHLYCLAQLILPANHRFSNHPTAGTAPPTAAERARILAQWAVNVVDFRDQDAACTRFAYDSTPFSPKGTPPVYWSPGASADDGVVWGLEQPEMLITESLAFHNSNVRRIPSPDPPPAPQFEQLRVPEGSVYLEFFVPRTTNNVNNGDSSLPPATGSLYTLDGTVPKLNLNKTAPNPDDTANPFPVWRVVFLKPEAEAAGGFRDAFTRVYEDSNAATRFYYSYQLGNDSLSGLNWKPINSTTVPTIAEPDIDRVLWFADVQPTATNHALPSLVADGITDPENYIFRFTAGHNVVSGGQYLVVGPRPITYIGSKRQTGVYNKRPSNHRIQLVDGWMQIWNQNNEPALWADGTPVPLVAGNTPANAANNVAFSDRIRDCVTMTAGMQVPDVAGNDWMNDTDIRYKWIGLNVSEPVRSKYYRLPEYFLNSSDNGVDNDTNAPGYAHSTSSKDAYTDLATNTGTPPQPLDLRPNSHLRESNWPGSDYPDVRTETNWTAAVLQRLADPIRPWHPVFNPYITVDWMSVDLTVFSGEERLPAAGPIIFASRQKTGQTMLPGELPTSPGLLQGRTFYSYHTASQTGASTATGNSSDPNFDYELPTELYTNSTPSLATRNATATFSTFGYLNPRFMIRGTGTTSPYSVPGDDDYQFTPYFRGAPGPNPWASTDPVPLQLPLAPYFPNRDFVNAYELTSVPLSAPGQFMQEFAFNSGSGPKFAHTLDFEDLLLPSVTPPTRPTAGNSKSSAILFECVGVKSPWSDSWRVVHPNATRGFSTGSQQEIAQTHLFEPYRAPFNMIPTYREPGRINLNTISEPLVYRGLMWNIMTPTSTSARNSNTIPYKASLGTSRQGFNTLTGPPPTRALSAPNPHLDARSPTEFLRIFGSPLTPYNFPLTIQQSSTSAAMTILRSGTSGLRILNPTEPGVYPGSNTGTYNTYTHNFPVSRMANLVTNRSNVFSIRMTLGFFEVDTSGQIGREYGAEQGRSKRHRAFYLIDRSIPVAYQMGDDFNAADCVLARSIIE